MPLKKLILNGFKSFADQTVIDFGTGITGIVGPNGSGKSNITEAIRWVMGESSAKSLRGSNMKDIIFAGSEFRKAMNHAEVTLVFANKKRELHYDSDLVTITRKLLRSGDSKYSINNKSVRLKDIHALFLDSGISQKSMAIISQGRVDQVLNSKPDQRREIFEEAAGVLHFKEQKELAQRQLAKTSDNLIRINDLVKELETRLAPLEEQSSLARQYRFQKKQLDQKLKTLLAFEIQNLGQSKQHLEADADKNMAILTQLDKEVKSSQAKLKNKKDTFSKLIQVKEKLSDELEEVKAGLARLNTSLEVNQQAAQFDQATQNEYHEQIAAIKNNLSESQEQENELTKALDQKTAQKKKLDTEKQQLLKQGQVSVAELNKQLEDSRKSYIEILQEQTAANNQAVYLKKELARNHEDQDRKVEDSGLQAAQNQLADLKEQGQKLKAEKTNLQDQVASLTAQAAQLARDWQEKSRFLRKSRNSLDTNQARLNALSRIQSRHDGYYYGVKNVLNHKGDFAGVVGAVGELISFSSELAPALITALGSGVQDIVMTDRGSARDAIQLLKARHAGRATFLPLDSLRFRKIPHSTQVTLSTIPGFKGVASDLVQTNNSVDISNAISFLLANVIVVDNIDTAMNVHRRVGHYRVVTLDGDIISPGGSMTGGGRNKVNNSPLQLAAEINELKKAILLDKKQLQQYHSQTDEAAENQKQANTNKEQKQRQLQEIVTQLREAAISYQNQEKEVSRLQAAFKLEDKREQERKKLASSLRQQISANQQRQTELLEQKNKLQANINALKQQLKQASTANKDLQKRLAKLEPQIAVYTNQIANLKEQKLTNKKEQDTLNNQQTVLLAKLQELAEKKNKQSESSSDFKTKKKQLVKSRDTASEKLLELNRQLGKLNAETSQLENIVSRNYELRKDAANEREEFSVRLTKLNSQIDMRLHKLAADYSLTYEAALASSKLENNQENRNKLHKSVKLHQMSIADIGPVNLQSITEYENVKQRYDFLKGQQDDLLTARSNLQQAMTDLDDKVKERFAATFSRIAASFSKIFPVVFGGGDAKLVLTHPDDLLATGIEIIARPPGKKLEHLSLLSGGERSLTAITLLFAMLEVNPVPFCILDEVEAALDDVNVNRFARFLRHFDLETQFIVITHRRGTMEKADQLYGVVMQESGISQVLSVSLDELKKEVH